MRFVKCDVVHVFLAEFKCTRNQELILSAANDTKTNTIDYTS